jgi:hypothetical protein
MLLESSLLKELDGTRTFTLYEYDTDTFFSTDDITAPSGNTGTGTITLTNTASASYFTITHTAGKSFCIVDNDEGAVINKKMHFAYNNNGTDITQLYMSFLKVNPNIGTL